MSYKLLKDYNVDGSSSERIVFEGTVLKRVKIETDTSSKVQYQAEDDNGELVNFAPAFVEGSPEIFKQL